MLTEVVPGKEDSMSWTLKRHGPWLSTVIIGLALLAAGSFFLAKGVATRDEIRTELIAERIFTSQDASIPGVLVDDPHTARAQADAIKNHTLGTWGPYSQLARDDPRRASFIDGVALRSALNQAVIGFGLTDMAIGAGIIIVVAGFATLLFGAPSLYFLAGIVAARSSRE